MNRKFIKIHVVISHLLYDLLDPFHDTLDINAYALRRGQFGKVRGYNLDAVNII